LLGFIIEKVSGKPYEQVLHEMIFTPLHLDHSGFDFASLKSADKAIGYFALSQTANTPAGIVDSSASYAAGAIYTTASDLYKWDRALYTEKIISKMALQDAYTIRKSKYGLGWSIDSAYGKPVYQHGGGIFGFTSFLFRSPEENICILLLDNKGDGTLEKIAAGINAILHNKPYELPKERIAIAIDTAAVKQYAGEYELSPGFILAITLEDGRLMVQATGQGKAELYAEKQNFFFLKVADVQIEFIKNDNGVTDKLILHQGGRDMPAKKIK
jgi:CubicO group peptidase (beta-lactamase class C family)